MFPNDDICNVDAAKQAAQRVFRRYRNRTAAEGGLGSSEVNRLMKATYEAINMRISWLIQPTTPTSTMSRRLSVFLTPTTRDRYSCRTSNKWQSSISAAVKPS